MMSNTPPGFFGNVNVRIRNMVHASATLSNGSVSSVEFSSDYTYRTRLKHVWTPKGDLLMFGMMNPSRASHIVSDATVTLCGKIAAHNGFGGMMIGNACALITSDPRLLLTVDDPVGPDNAVALAGMSEQAAMIVVAHGQLPQGLQRHADNMVNILRKHALAPLHVLALSKDGVPMHPLARGKHRISPQTIPFIWR